mmetsp:Transcript_3541/g.16167  ORF Transcript_3541/g.16167 Transcript_3541/m.16167 type:complete len:214 (+) Transcript_3541:2039-2680(+)
MALMSRCRARVCCARNRASKRRGSTRTSGRDGRMGMVRSSRRSATTRFDSSSRFLSTVYAVVLSVRVLFVILAGRIPRELPLALPHAIPECAVWILLRVADVRVREVSSILSLDVAARPRLSFADCGAFRRLRLPRLRLPHLPRRILILLRVVERGRRVERQRPRRPRRFPLARRRRQLVKAPLPSDGPSVVVPSRDLLAVVPPVEVLLARRA